MGSTCDKSVKFSIFYGAGHKMDAKLLMCDLGMVIVDLDYGDYLDRREVFPFQNALSNGLPSIADGCGMPAGDVPHGIVTLQSYMLASVKERKGSSVWVWTPDSSGERIYDRVGNVTQRELIDHEAKLGRQSHEWEGLMV